MCLLQATTQVKDMLENMRNVNLSRTELSLSDEWETPHFLFEKLCQKYDLRPDTDIAATLNNSKCNWCLTKRQDSLKLDWKYNPFIETVWCNPPHSKTKDFVLKAHEQWKKHNINIIMLVPAGVLCRRYFEEIFEKFIETNHGVEWHPVRPRPSFINPLQKKSDSARQDYIVIIWRKQND